MDVSKSSTGVRQYRSKTSIPSARQMDNIGREVNRLSMSRDVSKTPTGYHYQIAGETSFPHRFGVNYSDTKGAVDIDTGGWNQNGVLVVDAGGTTKLGDTTNVYIKATITHDSTYPVGAASIVVSDTNEVPPDSDFTKERLICKLHHDTSGNLTTVDRYQVGDIYQRLDGIISGGSWSDGGKGGSSRTFLSAIRYDDSSHSLQAKTTPITVQNGSTYIGAEDTGWSNVFTALPCPEDT